MVLGGFGEARCVLVRLLVFSAVLYSHNLTVNAQAEEPLEYQEEPRVGMEEEGAVTSLECGECAKRHSQVTLTESPEKDRRRISGILEEQKSGVEPTSPPGKGNSPTTR
jgi:hypothetical protein